MTTNEKSSQSGPKDWSLGEGAIEAEYLAPGVVMLQHSSHPFEGSIDPNGNLQQQAQVIAHRYLLAVRGVLPDKAQETARTAIELLAPDHAEPDRSKQQGFGWLDIAWGGAGSARSDPRLSFWVARRDKSGIVDRTLVLCAGFRDKGLNQNGEKGLRVVMHVGTETDKDGRCAVRVTGFWMSLEGVSLNLIKNQEKEVARLDPWTAFRSLHAGLPFLSAAWAGYNLVDNSLGDKTLQFFVNGSRSGADDPARRSFSLVAEFTRQEGHDPEFRTLALGERASHAKAGEVFPRDPATAGSAGKVLRRRPTVPFWREDEVDTLRTRDSRLPVPPHAPTQPPATEPLDYPPGNVAKLFAVEQSPLEGGVRGQTRMQSRQFFPLRSNDLAAEHAFVRGRDLFDRLAAYGFHPNAYFRMARLPLVIHHRAGIVPGARDGETVNAQVRALGDGLVWDEDYDEAKRSQIEVRFAAADLSHRRKGVDSTGRRRAQYLGLAADPRWAWHEFGHVLNFAATGELELRFAHSVGDALAAVIADAESELAEPHAGRPKHCWRGVTFPWVALNRRHDRKTHLGWGFDSLRYRESLGNPLAPGERFRAYFAEQLLSSAIFRLYRCIGGDSDVVATRCSAADYVVYLLMRAIALLGPQSLVPARTADHFVSALMDADLGTGIWDVETPWNADPAAQSATRVGGCVHKVVRWAFERQGLYASQPPAVDVYIADRRPLDNSAGDGGYWPVPLKWEKLAPQPWHAHPDAIAWDGTALTITVGNRGTSAAAAVSVHAWKRRVDEPNAPWDSLAPEAGQPFTVPAKGAAALRFDAGQPDKNRDYYVVAAASCAADRVNFDPAQWLPSASAELRVDLIANDNNVGLWVMRFA